MPIILNAAAGGPYVVALRGYTPSPRDDTPWTSVQWYEGPTETGPWTALVSGALSPLDSDPANPQSRDFTLKGATLANGWYYAVFQDGTGGLEPTEPVFNGPPIRPTLADIGALLHSRTTIDGGGEAGTFNTLTDPTGDQVQRLIDVATSHVAIQVPRTLNAEQAAYARVMVSYLAAILVEKSHFSEQVESGDSLAGLYTDLLDTGMTSLIGMVNNDNVTAPRVYGTPIGTVIAGTFSDTAGLLP